jgi:Polyketide synthesis cyclase
MAGSSTSPAIGQPGQDVVTEVTVAVLDPETARHPDRVEEALAKREDRATWQPGAGRVELFRYRDLAIRIASGAAVRSRRSETALAGRAGARLECPEPFYSRQLSSGPPPAEAFSAIVVNRMAPRHRDRVAELFAGLDATDFPSTMGTRARRLYSVAPDIYLHVQEFEQGDGLAVIDEAWRDSDPRFLQIVADLTPLVPPYDDTCATHEDHVAQRFHVRSAP